MKLLESLNRSVNRLNSTLRGMRGAGDAMSSGMDRINQSAKSAAQSVENLIHVTSRLNKEQTAADWRRIMFQSPVTRAASPQELQQVLTPQVRQTLNPQLAQTARVFGGYANIGGAQAQQAAQNYAMNQLNTAVSATQARVQNQTTFQANLAKAHGIVMQMQAQQQAAAARQAAASQRAAHRQVMQSWNNFTTQIVFAANNASLALAHASQRIPLIGPLIAANFRGSGIGMNLGAAAGRLAVQNMGFMGRGMGMAGAIGGGLLGSSIGGLVGTGAAALFEGLSMTLNTMSAAASTFLNVLHEIVTGVVTLGMEFERTRTSFEVFTGSVEAGNKLFEELQKLSIETPYNFRQLAGIGQMLMGMGVPAEQVTNVVARLGDIAAGDITRLQRLALAFGQVTSAERYMGTELRQFTESGVGIKDFADAVGMTTAQFRDLQHEGRITRDHMIAGINAMTNAGGRFYGMNIRQSRTVAGEWSNLVDKVEMLGGRLGQAIFARFDIAGMIGRVGDFVLANADKVFNKVMVGLEYAKAIATGFFQVLEAGWATAVSGVDQYTTKFGQFNAQPQALNNVRQMVLDITLSVIDVGETFLSILHSIGTAILELIIKPLAKIGSIQGPQAWLEDFQNYLQTKFYALGLRESLPPLKNFSSFNKSAAQRASEDLERGVNKMGQMFEDAPGAVGGGMGELRNRILRARNEPMPNLQFLGATTGERELQDFRNWLVKTHPSEQIPAMGSSELRDMFNSVRQQIDAGQQRPNIQLPPVEVMDKSVQKLIEGIRNSIEEGMTPLDKFLHMGDLLMTKGTGLLDRGKVTAQEASVGLYQAYQELEKSFASQMKEAQKLPEAAFQGTQEAMDAINKAQQQIPSTMDEVRQVLDFANDQRKEAIRKAGETVDAIYQLEGSVKRIQDLRGVD